MTEHAPSLPRALSEQTLEQISERLGLEETLASDGGPALRLTSHLPMAQGEIGDMRIYAGGPLHQLVTVRIVVPAIRSYNPDLIVVACGLDANCLDPLARMLAHSGTFRSLADTAIALADELCDGRIAMIHEGGYAETYVPFCSHAVLEALAGIGSDVTDPTGDMFVQWQPNERYAAFQRELIDEMAAT